MKLIDLLVQELPGRGGWPVSGSPLYAVQDKDREVKFAFCDAVLTFGRTSSDRWGSDARESWFDHGRKHIDASNFKASKISSDYEYRKVTLEEYNYALAVSKKTVRGGEVVLPVGFECEWYKHTSGVAAEWKEGVIKYFSDCTVIIKTGEPGEIVGHPCNFCFRPARTEADRKREEFAHACIAIDNKTNPSNSMEFFCSIYDAISAGKIHGIRLE